MCRGEIDIQYILKRDEDHQENLNIIRTSSDDEYIGKIRKRLHEDSAALEEREKRRRKVLREQLAAHQAQEVGKICCFSSSFVSAMELCLQCFLETFCLVFCDFHSQSAAEEASFILLYFQVSFIFALHCI